MRGSPRKSLAETLLGAGGRPCQELRRLLRRKDGDLLIPARAWHAFRRNSQLSTILRPNALKDMKQTAPVGRIRVEVLLDPFQQAGLCQVFRIP